MKAIDHPRHREQRPRLPMACDWCSRRLRSPGPQHRGRRRALPAQSLRSDRRLAHPAGIRAGNHAREKPSVWSTAAPCATPSRPRDGRSAGWAASTTPGSGSDQYQQPFPSPQVALAICPMSFAQLRLLSSERRYARDAYALSVLRHPPRFALIVGHRDAENSPLIPTGCCSRRMSRPLVPRSRCLRKWRKPAAEEHALPACNSGRSPTSLFLSPGRISEPR